MKYFLIAGVALTVLVLLGLLIKAIPLLTAKPTIKVDYVSEYNRMTKPANYDSNENAAFDYKKAYEALVEMPQAFENNWHAWPGDLIDSEMGILRDWIGSNSETLIHLEQAVAKPYSWFERHAEEHALWNIELPEVQTIRGCAYLMYLQAKLKAYEGDIEGGLEEALDLHKMGMHLLGPFTLVEQLVGIAMCALSFNSAFSIIEKTGVEAETLEQFQSKLGEQLEQSKPLDFSVGERIYGLDIGQRMFTDDGKGDGKLIPLKLVQYKKESPILQPISYIHAVLICIGHPGRRETGELFEKLYNEVIKLGETTPWELYDRGTSYENYLKELTEGNYWVNDGVESIGKVCEIYQRHKITGEALITVVALLRHKADVDKYPESLEELVRGNYIGKLPIDPYGRGSLVYRRTNGNFTLYSVGANFKDDGGVASNWGEGERGGDQVFWPWYATQQLKDKQ